MTPTVADSLDQRPTYPGDVHPPERQTPTAPPHWLTEAPSRR
jgi:hypothetical protein